ncbi:carbonic anhydrase [Asticcacaulis sp. EMRT-3]|uniref:carbonic anhydrase n=1 Tax=Asticcacaulis sp. EMRT-3 TaxID=3040349 RepID=UPI0024AF8CDB|nr:carbonic anhydrase [Asticcacaulis sp. EMRT-3]MDI7775931.1 carbonic anhydrase [Asticcacaulis sp. EMRT-3]
MLNALIDNNRHWARTKTEVDPDFFRRLVAQQSPEYLWIGCSDSRVPATEIVDLDPGEMFVHRNIANMAPSQDANYLSVLQFAVQVLKVKHILVVGHYGCGGVRAAIESKGDSLIDHWLAPIREVAHNHADELAHLHEDKAKFDRLCELNVIQQVRNVSVNPIVQRAWSEGQSLAIHGWVYALSDGLVTDQGVTVSSFAERMQVFGI